MSIKNLIYLPFLLLGLGACDDDNVDPLPETVTIEIKETQLSNLSVILHATEPGNGQAGHWIILSDNSSTASFSDDNDPAATFTGDPLETYKIQWTLSVGPTAAEERSATIAFRIVDGFSVQELMAANISLFTLSDSLLVGDLKAAGATETQLRTNGVIGDVQDSEGNIYPWVKIKDKIWMAKNLEATKYSDGTDIPNAGPFDGDATTIETYGLMYDWYGARRNAPETQSDGVQGACPTGWHIPTFSEYQALPTDVAVLKATGTLSAGNGIWEDPGSVALQGTNKSGFSAVPAGFAIYRPELQTLTYQDQSTAAAFWASAYSSGSTTDHSGTFTIRYNTQSSFYYASGGGRQSLRCVKN